MQKIYYDEETNFICNRFPNYKPAKENSPFIEVTDEEEQKTYFIELGYAWGVVNGKLTKLEDLESKNSEEYKQMIKNNQLVELKQYLADTDYVITKLNEAKLEDEEEFNSLKLQYANVLEKRKETRAKINELESV